MKALDAVGRDPSLLYTGANVSVSVLIVAGSKVNATELPVAVIRTPLALVNVVVNPSALLETTLPVGVLI